MNKERIYTFSIQSTEVAIRDYNPEEIEKSVYVERWLSPAVAKTDCGWHGCQYAVYEDGMEIVWLLDNHGKRSRGINVSCDSKLGLAADVFENID